jgi:hypothetical protein
LLHKKILTLKPGKMETTKENFPKQKQVKKGAFGVIVILAGLLLLASVTSFSLGKCY